MQQRVKAILDELMERLPKLAGCRPSMESAFACLQQCYGGDHKVMVCGNGGSAADAEHVVGELMKGFRLKRSLSPVLREQLRNCDPLEGDYLASNLQGALTAISLVSHTALLSALANDIDPEMVYAQQVYGYGQPGDVLIGFSTSGNAKNVLNAVKVAKAFGIHTIGLTGQNGRNLAQVAQITIQVPATATYQVQEYHLSVYHALCAMIESEFFRE
jgi:phosphoheptose isomerase